MATRLPRKQLPDRHAKDAVPVRDTEAELRATLRELEEKLARSERRLRDFIETSPCDWVWESGPDLRFTYLNELLPNAPGVPVDSILGKKREEVFADDVKRNPKAWTAYFDAIETRQPIIDFEIHHIRGDGTEKWISTSGKPLFDADGHFLGYRGTTRDITQQKQQERERRQADQRHAAFAAAVSEWMWEMDKELRFCYISKDTIPDLNIKAQNMLGMTRWEFYALFGNVIDDEQLEAHRATLLAHKSFSGWHVIWINPETKDKIYVELSGDPIFDKSGAFQGYRGISRNITAAVQRRIRYYPRMIEENVFGTLIQRDWKPLYANRALADMFGYRTPEDIVALGSIEALFAPHERKRLRAYHNDRLAGKSASAKYEFDGVHKSGKLIRVANGVQVIEDPDGPLVHVTMIDRTPTHQTMQKVRSMAEGSLQCLIVHVDGKPIFANQAAADLLGYKTVTEFLNRSVYDWFMPYEKERLERNAKDRLAGSPTVARYECDAKHKKGHMIPIEILASLVEWEGQVAIQVAWMDKREQRRSEHRFQNLAEASLEGIIVQDSKKILFANPALVQMLGYDSVDELRNVKPAMTVAPKQRKTVRAKCLKRLRGEPAEERYEYDALRKDGTTVRFYICNTLVRWHRDDRPDAVLSTVVDISELRQAQEALAAHEHQLTAALIKTQETEQERLSSDLHDAVLGNLSQMRMVLTAMIQRMNIAQRDDLSDDEKELPLKLEHAVREIRSIVTRMYPPKIELGINEALKNLCKSLPNDKAIRITLSSTLPNKPSLPRDWRLAIYRIASEALVNIHKHSQATQAQITLKATAQQLLMTITDDGIGLPEENAAGLIGGIGLASMKRRAEHLGGTLELDKGRKGQGTKVSVCWPLSAIRATNARSQTVLNPCGQP